MLKYVMLALIGLVASFAFMSNSQVTPAAGPDQRVLFIGNSFTYGGDVPTQVKNIAATSRPPVNLHVEMVVRGGAALAQHIAETDALSRLQDGEWDVVVLQDASVMAFHPEGRAQMTAAAISLAAAASAQGADVVYFAHWAPHTQAQNIPQAIRTIEQAYERLSRATGGQTARAGRVWQVAGDAGVGGGCIPKTITMRPSRALMRRLWPLPHSLVILMSQRQRGPPKGCP